MKKSDFVHLHVHTQYSLMDSTCKIEKLVARASEFNMPAVAMTDHGNVFGVIEFYTQAIESKVKPIIGYEAYVAPRSRKERKTSGDANSLFHLTLLAKDKTGYQNLLKLAMSAYLEESYRKPRIDKKILSELSSGLIVLSGCLKGEIPFLIQTNKFNEAKKAAAQYKDIMGDGNFYLEMGDQGINGQKKVNKALLEIGKSLDIPVAATNNCHYIRRRDAAAHDALLCIRTGANINDPARMKFPTNNFYFRSADEMKSLFSSIPDAISNTIVIAEKCNLELDFEKRLMPRFSVPKGESPNSYLKKLCQRGLKIRFGTGNKGASKRMKHELSAIQKMGYANYFLIVWDIIQFAKRTGLGVGPGRNSAPGSLAAYVLGITKVNPLQYGLIFERFLSEMRMGEVCFDVCDDERSRIIEYIKTKYGNENVFQIATFGALYAKSIIRETGRALGIPHNKVNRAIEFVPSNPDMTVEHAMSTQPKLRKPANVDVSSRAEKVRRLLSTARTLEGLPRYTSVSSAGIIISDRKSAGNIPIMRGKEGKIVTQLHVWALKKLCLLKINLLGMKELSIIRDTLRNIEKTSGKKINIDEAPLDDPKTFELLRKGKTLGVFCFEGRGMRNLLRKMEPDKFEDLINALGLYRPSFFNSGIINEFIKRKHRTTPLKFDHPALESALSNTYGIILYQEQITKIAGGLADFSFEKSVLLRKNIRKMIPRITDAQRKSFVKDAVKKGISKQIANKTFDMIIHFGGFGLNKAHTTAYAMIAYQMAYLKANYAEEFFSALLSRPVYNKDKLALYISECKNLGISTTGGVNELG